MAEQGQPDGDADRALTVDQAVVELRQIVAALDGMPDGDPRRAALLARRDELRAAARLAADAIRSPEQLEYELGHLRRRLASLGRERIGPSWAEKDHLRWINDASAYSRAINERIEAENAEERAFLESRIAQLEASLPEARERNR
jgi:hypothetical protein